MILQQDVKKLGKKGEVIDVAEGYGRNFLIPRGLAVLADDGQMRQLRHENRVASTKKERERAEAEQLKAMLESLTVDIAAKTGDKGRLFGSITAGDIADAIEKATGVAVDRRKVDLADPIKALGTYTVPLKVYAGITANLKVEVKSV